MITKDKNGNSRWLFMDDETVQTWYHHKLEVPYDKSKKDDPYHQGWVSAEIRDEVCDRLKLVFDTLLVDCRRVDPFSLSIPYTAGIRVRRGGYSVITKIKGTGKWRNHGTRTARQMFADLEMAPKNTMKTTQEILELLQSTL